MIKDPYEILGVSKAVGHDELQAAYRKLAKQYHPDRNIGDPDAESKFRDVQEAYDILSDTSQRSKYDQYGFSAFGGQDQWNGFAHTMHDIFGRSNYKGRNIQIKVKATLEEIAAGCSKTVKYAKSKICVSCVGSGSKNSQKCHGCGGTGVRHVTMQGSITLQTACQDCHGLGSIVVEKCDACAGSGYQKDADAVDIVVNVPAGSEEGVIKMPGYGEVSRERAGFPGDLLIHLSVEKHDIFQRHDKHIVIDVPCTFSQLYFGFEVEVPTVYREKIMVKIPAGTMPNAQIRVAGKGFPGGRMLIGDMFLIPKIDVPKNMSAEYENAVRQLANLDATNVSKRRQDWLDKVKRQNSDKLGETNEQNHRK